MKFLFIALLFSALAYNAQGQDTCHQYAPQREIINPNAEAPYFFVCHITTDRKKKFWFGSKKDAATFTFISPKVIIGAYHAIMQLASKIKSIKIEIYAHEENNKPIILKSIELSKRDFSLVKPFPKRGKENDCGLIILNNPMPDLQKKFPKLVTFGAAKSLSENFNISGYPYDEDIPEYNGAKLWERTVLFSNVTMDNNVVSYPCVKTAVGDSGGPLWIIRDGQIYLFGTHVGGNGNNYNNLWGQCFDEEKIQILNKILEDNQ